MEVCGYISRCMKLSEYMRFVSACMVQEIRVFGGKGLMEMEGSV